MSSGNYFHSQYHYFFTAYDDDQFFSLNKTINFFLSLYQGYKPPDEGPSEYQTIPLNKIEDFGVHCKQYVLVPVIIGTLY